MENSLNQFSPTDSFEDIRTRILLATAELIAGGGREAATTRAVASKAAVQAPTIYRLFGDKEGLLDAVAEHGMAAYVAEKSSREPHPDPVQDLRNGWDLHVEFGLAHPGLFSILSDNLRPQSPAAAAGLNVLRRRIEQIARAGRLRVSEDRALALTQSFCIGTVMHLLNTPTDKRDPDLSGNACEALLNAITGEAKRHRKAGVAGLAVALRASLNETNVLSAGEQHLLEEILVRIAANDTHRQK